MHLIQHYVIKLLSDLRQIVGFHRVLWFPFTYKIDRHDITDIFLKVALNTITLYINIFRSSMVINIMGNDRYATTINIVRDSLMRLR